MIPKQTDELVKELIRLLTSFEQEIAKSDLREKVRLLIPAHETFQLLGQNLILANSIRKTR